MKVLLFIFLSLLIIEPTFAQSLSNPAIGRLANLDSLAARQYLSGKCEESLALYQKAITKAESEYGKNSRVAGDLYYELGVRAFWLSKFNLAEHSFKKAVEINPNSEAAQLMLINLLRFRNRDAEAYGHIQHALKKHPDSAPLRKDLVISLQEGDPFRATQQAYLVTYMQNGLTEKLPDFAHAPSIEPKKLKTATQSEKPATKKDLAKSDNPPNKKTKTSTNKISKVKVEPQASKVIYEPVHNTTTKNTTTKPVKSKKTPSTRKNSNKLPVGLVPPPPPDIMDFTASPHGGMKAKAGTIKLEKAQPAPATEEHQKSAVEHPSADNDPDFLIEWASVKKKHPPTSPQTK